MYARIRPAFFLLIALTLATSLPAQIHGVPASVTSIGFGGNFSSAPGVPASVTSLGPFGLGNSPAVFRTCCLNAFRTGNNPPVFGGRRHGGHTAFFPVAVPVYSVPYTPVIVVQPESPAYDEDGEAAVVTTRHTERIRHVRERIVEEESEPPAPAAISAVSEPVVAQPATVLVFQDGHRSEIQNYAIVGDTLFNLTDSRSYKILLADLDLGATRKANADRGVDFQLPPAAGR